MPVYSLKQNLRSRLLYERQTLSPLCAKEAAAHAAENALTVLQPFQQSCTLGLYAPFRDELDCFVLASILREKGYALALPAISRSFGKPYPMVFREWDHTVALEQGYAGIAQPAENASVVFPDIVFVPLVGFDKRGYRLGYGQGFYDRAIPQLRQEKKCCFYGYAYAMQEVDYVPHEAHDIPLDGVITERDIFLFK